jgi:uncharacterized protein YdaU (DUF1376 family)
MAWFAFDVDADTMHLTAEQDGIYMRLLRHYYKTRVPLPKNDKALSSISRVGMDVWHANSDVILAFFIPAGDKLTHHRCDYELNHEDRRAKFRSERAQKAALVRWGISNTYMLSASSEHSNGMLDASSENAKAMLNDATRPDHTEEEKETRSRSQRKSDATDLAADFGEWWLEVPKKVGKGQAERAYRAARKEADAATLLAGMSRYAAQRDGQDVQFTKHPATWLNGKCWLDQPAKPNGGHSRPWSPFE